MAQQLIQHELDALALVNAEASRDARPWVQGATYGVILAASDCAAILVAFVFALFVRMSILPQILHVPQPAVPVDPYLDVPWMFLLWVAVFYYEGLYSRGLGRWDELIRIPRSILFAALLTVGATFIRHNTQAYSRAVLLGTCVFSLLSVPSVRIYCKERFLQAAFPIRVLVFGGLDLAVKDNPRLRLLDQCGYSTLDRIPLDARSDEAELRRFVQLAVSGRKPDEIVVDAEGLRNELLHKMLRAVEAAGRPVRILASLSIFQLQASVRNVDGLVLFDLNHGLARPLSRAVKRVLDVAGSAAILLLCLPLLVVIAVLIKLDSDGPVFYGHRRLAPDGRTFHCLKFRTMFRDADQRLREWIASGDERAREFEREFKLKNDPRITRIGRVLRKSSLDELPQLINVLRGEMSLVGPRPIVVEEVVKYGNDVQYLSAIRGGMTGLWQVSGRNDIGYSERITLDTYYARNWSCWLDLVILFKTVSVVLRRAGAY